MKFAAVAAFVLLAGAGPFAQQLGPQVLSIQGPTVLLPSPPPSPSPFAARPDTYTPHYDRPSTLRNRRGYSYVAPYFGSAVDAGPAPAAPAPKAPEPPSAAPPSEPLPVPEPPRIAIAHGPDLFYVIPGCYAGNRPPIRERLPKGCDPAKMRTTPIR